MPWRSRPKRPDHRKVAADLIFYLRGADRLTGLHQSGSAMNAPALAFTLPDLAALAFVLCTTVPVLALFWRPKYLLGQSTRRQSAAQATGNPPGSAPLGLTGQWAIHERRVAAGIDRQNTAAQLHRQLAIKIGALDYEIDQLWRETRGLGTSGAARPALNALAPSVYTRRRTVRGSESSLAA